MGSVLAAAPAQAGDARLTKRLYSADEVVHIDGKLGVQATVAFADDEHIENVAVGDAESWQITPNKRANLLFVKPLAAAAHTNMTVVTDRHTYYFDLIASARATPVYALSFSYPAAPKKAAAGQPGMPLTNAERAALNAEAPVDPAQLNFAWSTKGPRKLIPQRLYDDGESTYAVWATGVPIPAILMTNEKGDEGPVNFAVRGDTIVIDGVPSRIVLRVGRERAQLDYKGTGLQPRATAPATPPTVAPAVVAIPAITARSD
ncbi:TrbG/VirB9 family P-type conjugative transfer protein [Novosphingobium sp. G106]|nr:TrbG/VirB9 family P-type conjugative transfer protein [Novosphingobium sp. G106]